MFKFRVWSDTHIEFGNVSLSKLVRPDDANTVLFLAGDIGVGLMHRALLEKVCKRFKAVVLTTGNHEYYENEISNVDSRLNKLADQIPNLHFLNPGTVLFTDENVCVLGCTLWTDYNRNNPIVVMKARQYMNDFRHISVEHESGEIMKLQPYDVVQMNNNHRTYLRESLMLCQAAKRANPKLRVVVMTHHAPFTNLPRNDDHGVVDDCDFGYFNTGLEDLAEQCDLWIHGHTHQRYDLPHYDGEDGKACRVITNSRGYRGYQKMAKTFEQEDKVYTL